MTCGNYARMIKSEYKICQSVIFSEEIGLNYTSKLYNVVDVLENGTTSLFENATGL